MSRRVALRAFGYFLIGVAALFGAQAIVFVPEAGACLPGFKPKPGVTNPTDNERDCEPEGKPASPPPPGGVAVPPEPRRPKKPPIVSPSEQRKKVEDFLRERSKGEEGEREAEPSTPKAPPPGESADDSIKRLGEKLKQDEEGRKPLGVPGRPCERLTRAKEQAREKKDECDDLRRKLRQAELKLQNYQSEYDRRAEIYRRGGDEFSPEDLRRFRKEKVEQAEEEVEELKRKLRACEEARARIGGEIAKLPGCGEEKPGPTAGPGEGDGKEVTRAPEPPGPRPECEEGERKLLEEFFFGCKVLDLTRKVGVKLVPEGVIRGAEEGAAAVETWIDLNKCLELLGRVAPGPAKLLTYCFKAGRIFGEALSELGKKLRHLDVIRVTGVLTIPIVQKRCLCRRWEICKGGKWQPEDAPGQLAGCGEGERSQEIQEFPVDVQPRDPHSYNNAVEKIRNWMEKSLENYPTECVCPAR